MEILRWIKKNKIIIPKNILVATCHVNEILLNQNIYVFHFYKHFVFRS